jgi:Family of unknown function (DUF6166)
MSIAYLGVMIDGTPSVWKYNDAGEPSPLLKRSDLRQHSGRFEWGKYSPGSSQLALAILADVLDDDEAALDYYLQFQVCVVNVLGESFMLDAGGVVEWYFAQLEFATVEGGAA